MTSASGRSKSIEPRRRRRWCRISNSSCISSNIGTSGWYCRDGVRVAVGEDGVDRRVGHPRVAVDHAVVHLVAHDLAAAIHLHQARLHQPIDVRIEAAQPGGQLRRKHVDGALGEVHRRAALVGLLVERAAFLHVVRHVGDVHAEPVVAVRQPLDGDRIVEVARVLAVDRDRRHLAEIGAPADVPLLDGAADPAGLFDGLLGMRVRDVELADDDLRVDAWLVDVPEHLDHPPDRTARGGRPARDLDEHHLAGFRGRRLAGRHVHVGQHPAIERHDVAEAAGRRPRSGRRSSGCRARECG